MNLGTRLFVSNLPENCSETDLRSTFSKFGEINNLELKSKSSAEDKKVFAFITLNGSNYNIESCIKHFTSEEFQGNRLYVTRARESFLERLQRERQDAQRKEIEKEQQHEAVDYNPVIKLSEKLNPRKRKIETKHVEPPAKQFPPPTNQTQAPTSVMHNETEKKRLESMKQKRQEFKQKQMIIKAGLSSVDKLPNKKVIFSDNEEDTVQVNGFHDKSVPNQKKETNKNSLFNEDDDSDDEQNVNFEIKKQFEGKKGQKVLDLQSRYKSDKRFTLDERFIEDEADDDESEAKNEEVELSQADEKNKQLNILQNVLGVTIKRKDPEHDNQKKPKLGMLRFDPLQPDHAKFLVQVENKPESVKKSKKKKDKDEKQTKQEETEKVEQEQNKIEVSKETFYKVSETLKETIAQPKEFSLRSLFSKDVETDNVPEQETEYIPLEAPKKKKLNPLDPGQKNPFVYDSSDSEHEDEEEVKELPAPTPIETKAVWKENLFFTTQDHRLLDGLEFFSKTPDTEGQKDRRELKSLMKRRIHNKERKNQMFQKKIGGRRKTMKKTFRKKS